MIIGRLIPAGTGYNAYEEATAPEVDNSFDSAILDDDMILQDVVLDDRTARNYDIEGSLNMLADDEMIGGRSVADGTNHRPNGDEDGDDNGNGGRPMLDDDDLLIDDQTEAPRFTR